jgi:hypothetical protein
VRLGNDKHMAGVSITNNRMSAPGGGTALNGWEKCRIEDKLLPNMVLIH